MDLVNSSEIAKIQLGGIVERHGLMAVAKACRVSYQAVQKWLSTGRIPPNRCRPLEEAFPGEISRFEVRPDVFGSAPSNELKAAG